MPRAEWAGDRARRIGAVLWLLTAVILVGQVIAAAAWGDPRYSWTDNAISDLGVTRCGGFDDLGGQTRVICSPMHAVFNVAMVITGVLVAVGGWLLRHTWSTRPTRVAMVLMVPAGAAIAGVGLAPWDRLPDVHDLAASLQWLLQVVAMALCVSLIRDRRPGSRVFAVGTAAAIVVSLTGFVIFLIGPDGPSMIGWGLSERMAFDVLTLWTMAVGAHVLLRPPAPEVRREFSPRQDG